MAGKAGNGWGWGGKCGGADVAALPGYGAPGNHGTAKAAAMRAVSWLWRPSTSALSTALSRRRSAFSDDSCGKGRERGTALGNILGSQH